MLDRTKRLSQKIPVWIEVLVIISIAFGLSIFNSFRLVSQDLELSNAVAVGTIVMEGIFAAICAVILYLRGWKLWRGFPFRTDLKYAALSLGLLALSYLGYAIFYNIAVLSVGAEAIHASNIIVTANIALIFAVSIVNPLFEETFVVYYLFERLKNYGPFIFVAVSSLIRVSYHLYQGWVGLLGILPLGIVFAIAFWKTKNLMPLYLAHAIQDLLALIAHSNQ